MKAFEDGERVQFVGFSGLHSKWDGREGVVLDSFRDYDGNRVMVQFDGETTSVSFDEDDFVAVKTTYEIINDAEESTWMKIALSDREAALIQMVIDGLNTGKPTYAPTLEMKKEKKK